MSTDNAVLDKLKLRADQADQIIVRLRSQLENVRKSHARNLCRQEEEKIKVENSKLRDEVEGLKQRLTNLEYRNGEKQIPMPSGSSPATPIAQYTKTPPVMDKKNLEQSNGSSAKASKKTKEPKPQKDGGKKTAGADDDKPIDVSRLNLKVGEIIDVKPHPDADTLYMETVNVGEEKPRTILSGLVKHIPIEQMRNRKAIFMCNLKPAKMRGIMSEGMIMCASTPEKVEILDVPEGCVPGDRVTFESFPGEPDAMLNPKKKIWEQVAPDLKVDENSVATYKGAPFTIAGKGICVAPSLKNVQIK
ncbi:aminoacyl tRNA synthase complex-interacting multifunctional protein 1-like isoform X2 [Lineus longissimus]